MYRMNDVIGIAVGRVLACDRILFSTVDQSFPCRKDQEYMEVPHSQYLRIPDRTEGILYHGNYRFPNY